MHNAVRSRRRDIVALLLQHKADHRARTEEGATPLEEAREFGDLQVLEAMKEHIASLDIHNAVSGVQGPSMPFS